MNIIKILNRELGGEILIRKIIRAFIGIAGFVLGFTTYLTLMRDYEMLTFGSDLRGFISQ